MSTIQTFYRKHALVRALLYPVAAIRRSLGLDDASKQALCNRHQAPIIHNLQHLLVGDPVIDVKDFNGQFRMSASGHLFGRILREGSYEPEIARLVERFAPTQRDILDVGANIGFFTVKFAKHLQQGRVLAVEPTRNALLRLKDNIARNGVSDKVMVFEGVATDREGQEEISFIEGKEEYSTLGVLAHPSASGETMDRQQVQGTTLNALVKHYELDPGFIKVDVEGAEHLVFGGAGDVLREHRPIILAELCDPLLRKNGSSAAAVMAMIQSAAYDIYDAEDPDREAGSDSYGNVICFPKESKVTKQALKSSLRNY